MEEGMKKMVLKSHGLEQLRFSSEEINLPTLLANMGIQGQYLVLRFYQNLSHFFLNFLFLPC